MFYAKAICNNRDFETMSLAGKLVSELELNVSADKYYNVFKDKVCHIPNISDIINKVEVHEGDWDNHGHGSIKIWNYTVGKSINDNGCDFNHVCVDHLYIILICLIMSKQSFLIL